MFDPERIHVPVPAFVTLVALPPLLLAMVPLRRAVPAVEPCKVRSFVPEPVLVMLPVSTSWPDAPDWSILTPPVGPPLRLMFLSEVSPVPVYLRMLVAVVEEEPIKMVPFFPRWLLLPVIPKDAALSVVVVLEVLALIVTGPLKELFALPSRKFPFPLPLKPTESTPFTSARRPSKVRLKVFVFPLELKESFLLPAPDIARSLVIVIVALPAVIVPPPVVPARSMTLSVVSTGVPARISLPHRSLR